jgi:ubiquitin-activating enzyme E1
VNFLFKEDDLGLNRASTAAAGLQQLNPSSKVSYSTSLSDLRDAKDITYSYLIVVQPLPMQEIQYWNTRCREENITFIYAVTGGICAHIFADIGEKHVVVDANGAPPNEKNIVMIVKESDSQIRLDLENPAGRPDRPLVLQSYYQIVGFEDILPNTNDRVFQVSRLSTDHYHSIRIAYDWDYCGPTFFSTATPILQQAGFLREVKQPETIASSTLQETLSTASAVRHNIASSSWYGIPEAQMDIAFVALHEFLQQNNGRMPTFVNDNDRNLFLTISREVFVSATKADVSEQQHPLLRFPANRVKALDEAFLQRYISHIMLELQPLAAFVGGLVAFEVIKRSGKFRPIRGLAHFSFPEVFPPFLLTMTPEEDELLTRELLFKRQARYRTLTRIFGREFLRRCQELRIFQIGCGALGCEYLKNFSLNGFCTDAASGGILHVTDADTIELSNLSRQFLFREHNVGQAKSAAAIETMQQINSAFHACPHTLYVGTQSETTFDDAFWQSQDIIVNALDNMATRIYSDRQCVLYSKPLFESGTEGVLAKTYTIIPHITASYEDIGGGSEADPQLTGNIPMCTLRDFPYIIEHCIEWARDLFALLFVNSSQQFLQKYVETSSFQPYAEKIRQQVDVQDASLLWQEVQLMEVLAQLCLPVNHLTAIERVRRAIQYAHQLFYARFRDRIWNLQKLYPRDHRIKPIAPVGTDAIEAVGVPFWDSKRRYPTPITFDIDNSIHRGFVWHLAALIVEMITTTTKRTETESLLLREMRELVDNEKLVIEIMSSLDAPSYCPSLVDIGDTTIPAAQIHEDSFFIHSGKHRIEQKIEQFQLLYSQLRSEDRLSVQAISLEKDDDDNHHVDFLTAATNLRAENYSLPRASFQRVKEVIGRIIPALAPTTSAICGLVTLQMLTLLRQPPTSPSQRIGFMPLSDIFYRSLDLGANFYRQIAQKAVPPRRYEHVYDSTDATKQKILERVYPDEGFTKWNIDILGEIHGSMTVERLIEWFRTVHGLELRTWIYTYGKFADKSNGTANAEIMYSVMLYNHEAPLDQSLLPGFELTEKEALNAMKLHPIMSKKRSKYASLWRERKSQHQRTEGERRICLDSSSSADSEGESMVLQFSTDAGLSLKQMFQRIESVARDLWQSKQMTEVFLPTVSNSDHRRYVLVSKGIVCRKIDSEEEIARLAPLLIRLDK